MNSDETHQEASSFALLLRSLVPLVIGLSVCLVFLWKQSRLRSLIVTDPLTGLYNRRGFLLLAQKQLELSARHHRPVLLFYIDVDSFKAVNDALGHRAGDAALKRVAAVLREAFRGSDIIGRLGGDEFAVLAVDGGTSARPLLEKRLRAAVVRANRPSNMVLSLSSGALLFEGAGAAPPIEDLLEKADALMYEEKRRRKLVRLSGGRRAAGMSMTSKALPPSLAFPGR